MPNQSRHDLFKDFHFLCVGEKDREIDSTLRTFISTGSGAIETFSVLDGKAKWSKALKRGEAKDKTLVVIADKTSIIAAVGEDGWKELDEEALR